MTSTSIIVVRSEPVMLDAVVAEYFGVTTGALNQAVSRNPKKFTDKHCFRLSEEEFENLRSQSVTSSSGHGGRRYAPMVYTMLGIARLATVLNSDAALEATDLILETFLEVRAQIASGRKTAQIAHPDRLVDHHDEEDRKQQTKFRKKLAKAMDQLLDTVIDVKTGASVRETAGSMSADALEHLRQRLRQKGLENEKLEAEVQLILAQAELVAAQVRETDQKTDAIALGNLKTRIRLVRELADLNRQMSPPALVSMLDRLSHPQGALALPAPKSTAARKKDDN
ncbi:ORF6N domain-containing protein [Novosphingobium marinum]|nr:ORF6N domain-containing protein [Novosphingobium marinum]